MSLKSLSISTISLRYPKSLTECVAPIFTKLKDLLKSLGELFFVFKRNVEGQISEGRTSSYGLFGKLRKFPGKKFLKTLVLIGVVLILLVLVVRITKIASKNGTNNSGQKFEVKAARSTHELNQDFEFSLANSKGEEISKIKFAIENAELRDEIIVQGKRATSVKGRVFLIINLKITNQYSQTIQMNTRDYVRLSVNGNSEELLAPDIHNDPVEIQAISTKLTRLGFPINETDKDLVLKVGEVNKDKADIRLQFD